MERMQWIFNLMMQKNTENCLYKICYLKIKNNITNILTVIHLFHDLKK